MLVSLCVLRRINVSKNPGSESRIGIAAVLSLSAARLSIAVRRGLRRKKPAPPPHARADLTAINRLLNCSFLAGNGT